MLDAATSSAVMTPTRDTPQQTERLTFRRCTRTVEQWMAVPDRLCFARRMTAHHQVKKGEETFQDHVTWFGESQPVTRSRVHPGLKLIFRGRLMV